MLKIKFIIIILVGLIPFGLLAQESDSIYKYSPDMKYGFGGGCGIGGGYSILTGNLYNYQPNFGSFNIGFNFVYSRFIYDISMIIGNTIAKKGYSNNDLILRKDSAIQIFEFENTLGFFMIDREKISVYPFAGIKVFQLYSFQGSDEIEGPSRVGVVFGYALDYRFSNTFGDRNMGDFIIGTRFSYNNLYDYNELNVSNLNMSIYFRFMIRSYRLNE